MNRDGSTIPLTASKAVCKTLIAQILEQYPLGNCQDDALARHSADDDVLMVESQSPQDDYWKVAVNGKIVHVARLLTHPQYGQPDFVQWVTGLIQSL